MEHRKQATGRYEWYTPGKIIYAAQLVMGRIDLDPASSAEANMTVGAAEYFDEAADGLSREWHGRVWLNPPYARRVIDKWIDKLIHERNWGQVDEYICLVNNSTETAWGQKLLHASDVVCLVSGRIKFYSPVHDGKAGSLQGSMIAYSGDKPELFYNCFNMLGWCSVEGVS